MHLPQSRKVCAAATTGGRFFFLSCVAHSRSADDDDDDRFGGDRTRMNERTRRRKINNVNNSPVGWVNEWSVWFFWLSQDPGTNPGTSHSPICPLLFGKLLFFFPLSSLFLTVFFVLFVFYLIPSLVLSYVLEYARSSNWLFSIPWRMNGPSQGRTQTSPRDFCFFSLHPSLYSSPSFFIVGGKALKERYSLLDEWERERENLISCGSSFVCWPWVAMFSETEGVVVFFLSCLCASIFEKTLFLSSFGFSRRRRRRLMIGTTPTKCRTIWTTHFCPYHVLACSENGRWVLKKRNRKEDDYYLFVFS